MCKFHNYAVSYDGLATQEVTRASADIVLIQVIRIISDHKSQFHIL